MVCTVRQLRNVLDRVKDFIAQTGDLLNFFLQKPAGLNEGLGRIGVLSGLYFKKGFCDPVKVPAERTNSFSDTAEGDNAGAVSI